MLSLKKTSFRKKIIYYFIIAVMLGGTIFSIYKNYKLASVSTEIAEDSLAITPDIIIPADGADLQTGQNSQTLTTQEINMEGFDADVLKDPRFVKLQDASTVQPPKIDLGKNNPFEPK